MAKTPLKIVVSGCCGRMGSLIAEEAVKDPAHFRLIGGLEHAGHSQVGQPLPGFPSLRVSDNPVAILPDADLLIEFTNPEATLLHGERAASLKVPMLIGTTGFSEEQFRKLKAFSRQIPIFWSPNMSFGIVLVRKTIFFLWDLYQKFGMNERTSIKISETHHAQKRDRPSGTAKFLAQEVCLASGRVVPDDQIQVFREGEVIGVHSLTFDSGSERITLQHDAMDRRLFAQGALMVAVKFHQIWKKPGFFGMDDFISGLQKL